MIGRGRGVFLAMDASTGLPFADGEADINAAIWMLRRKKESLRRNAEKIVGKGTARKARAPGVNTVFIGVGLCYDDLPWPRRGLWSVQSIPCYDHTAL